MADQHRRRRQARRRTLVGVLALAGAAITAWPAIGTEAQSWLHQFSWSTLPPESWLLLALGLGGLIIAGVRAGIIARVVRDTVTLDGEIIEDTFDWYAQDTGGTVWYLGEDTAEFEGGKITTREGSFEAGVDGAQAGVIMPASPEVCTAYRQEYYEGEAEDNGEVLAIGQQASVPAGQYDDLVQTADTTPLEPDVLAHKYYASGVGLVLTIDKEAGGREELLSVTQIPPVQARRAGEAQLGELY
jgi:hypothetical protein